jgi:hypothetical protein
MSKLVEKAKARRSGAREVTKDDIELALLWVKGDVGIVQVAHAYGKEKAITDAYVRLARALKQYLRKKV